MCTSTPWSASSVGGLESVVSRVECAFPHYSVVATGKWENQLRGAVEPSDSRYYRNPQVSPIASERP